MCGIGLELCSQRREVQKFAELYKKDFGGGGHKEGYLGTRATTWDPELDRILFHEDPRLNLRL